MPFDGSGNFTRDYNFVDDKNNGIKIVASRVDAEFNNYATALNQVLLRNGVAPLTGDLQLGTNTISGLGSGSQTTPSLRFNADGSTGVYLAGPNELGLSAGGTQRMRLTTAGAVITGAATVSSTLGVTGNTTLGGTLDVTGNVTVAASTLQLATNKLLMQHNGTNGFVRTQSASGNLYLGANGANVITINTSGTVAMSGALGCGGPVTATGGMGVGGNAVFPTASYAYSPYNGATDTGLVRSGVQFDGTGQTLNFYTANTYRGGFGATGDLTITGAAIATGASVSTTDCYVSVGGGRTGSGNAYLDLNGAASGAGYARAVREAGANGNFSIINNGTGSFVLNAFGAAPMLFATSNVERMRLTSTGLGIGTNSPAQKLDVEGIIRALSPNSGSTGAIIIRDAAGDPGACYLQAVSNDNLTQYGYIRLNSGTANFSGNIAPIVDGNSSVGSASFRWDTIYAVTGTINTSDENEKTWRGAMDADELRAATRIVDELGFFQWNDAIEAKGKNGARYHFGVKAQQVWRIMADEGLVEPIRNGKPGRTKYAFLCFDEWDDKYIDEWETVESDILTEGRYSYKTGKKIQTQKADVRYGLRLDQLTLFLVAAMHARLKNAGL